MDENTIVNGQELVEKVEEKVTEAISGAAENVAVTTQTTVPPISTPAKSYTGMNAAVGAGLIIGGGAIGFAVDHWVVPFFSKEQREARKAKRAEKKAAREAKKAAKGKGKATKPAKDAAPAETPAPAPAENATEPVTTEGTVE